MPPRLSRSWCVPRSAIPFSVMTIISSALRIVERRWAIVIVVRFFANSSRLFWMWRSLSLSRALVARQGSELGDSSKILWQWKFAVSVRRRALFHVRYIGVVTVRQGHNEIMNVGTPCCVYDFFHESSRLSVGDIFLDGSHRTDKRPAGQFRYYPGGILRSVSVHSYHLW